MDRVFDFLNQPIVLTIISLIVGSYLLSIVAERRSRRDRLKDKSIEFITEAADTVNAFVPLIYRQLRTNNLKVDQAIEDGITELFSSRLRIQVGSLAYLKSEEFARQYFWLLNELSVVMQLMIEFERGEDQSKTLEKVITRQKNLQAEWPLENEELSPRDGTPVAELILLMDLILHRITHLLSTYLEDVVG